MTTEIPLNNISISEASVPADESFAMYVGIAQENHYPDWVYYNSLVHENVEQIAEHYINNHACITVKDYWDEDYTTYSPTPIHVLRTKTFNKGVESILEGLLYSNGAVFLLHREDYIITMLWIAEKTIDTFGYNLPALIA